MYNDGKYGQFDILLINLQIYLRIKKLLQKNETFFCIIFLHFDVINTSEKNFCKKSFFNGLVGNGLTKCPRIIPGITYKASKKS